MASAVHFGPGNSGFQAGVINGSANTEFHHHVPPERPETPPNPSSIIPFGQDNDFIQRGNTLDRIHQASATPGTRIALVGLGGVGKSQLAIEYAYQVRQRSPDTWVFWVHASNATRYKQSFREIADHVKIPGRDEPQSNIFQLVCGWLRGGRDRRWRLILDNVDDAGFLLEPPSRNEDGQTGHADGRLVDYLPNCENGSVLVTSRSMSAAEDLVEPYSIIQVEPMSEAEAIALVEKKLRPEQDSKNTTALAAALERMPLAIVQATAYISKKAPRYSVRQYLEKFEQSDRKKANLLDYDAGKLRRDREARNSIIITWQISFDHIRRTRPSAADLLSLMSFYDRQGIPESLLQSPDEKERPMSTPNRYQRSPALHGSASDQESSEEDVESDSSMDNQFEMDVSTLRDYSFISTVEDGRTFEMHSLVQLATRQWLEAAGRQEQWKSQFIRRLDAQLPTGAYENWAICRALLPHAVSAGAQRPKDRVSLEAWTSILYKASWYFQQMGQGPEAQSMAEDAMKYRTKILGRTHEESLAAIEMVGQVCNLRGQWSPAEKLFVEVMETRKQKLGPDHPDTLTSMANLALTYWNQGRWEEAEKLFMEVMETSKQKLGPDHPDTLTSMANLASTYRNQGRWEEAEKLDVEVMETRKQKLGPDHPDTLTSMSNLASTYRNQGRWEEAEKLDVKMMETRKQKLGPDHPSTLTGMANLASTYRNQGRWEEAEKLDVEVMETRKQKLGPDHPSMLTSMANLASTYRNQGRWEEAEKLEVEVMEMSKQKLGPDHPSTLTSMGNLASTYRNQGRWEEAEKLEVEVMETRKQKLGPDHPSTLTSMGNLASTYWNQGRWEEAEKLEVEVMETRKQKLGPDHPSTLTSMANLASTYWNQGRWEEAEKLEVEVMETRKQKLGPDHLSTLTSMGNLASTYRNQGRWEEAEKLEVEVMETRKQKLGPDHPDMLTSMSNLASTYRNQGRWEEAEKLDVEVMETRKQKLGPDHPSTLTSMANLASTYWNQGRWEEAEKLEVETMEMSKQKLGPDHPSTLTSMGNLASTYWNQGRWEEAEKLEVEVMETRIKADYQKLSV
ncbi:Uu.00g078300.m01.CDS01 [Anthostomella pinea]|uniref:Uu.00g078300.m01.CDS01 n=1 Tax=Anthostomella pinea TaxID=933095 RepID=A0AAI8YGQ3_9PEZI|nr:Uu.00g078300.m01.CDS01 [Anthostomella pinea]